MQYSIAEFCLIFSFDCICVFELSQEDTGKWNSEYIINMAVCEASTFFVQPSQKSDRFVNWEVTQSGESRSHEIAEIAKLFCGGFHFCY